MYLFAFQKLALRASTFFFFSTIIISPCKAYVDWLYPPSSSSNALAYNYNDVVYFTWDSNFTNPCITLWCATKDEYYTLYSANVTTNGTDPQSFPYSDAFNHTCHMSLYCHGSPECGPVVKSPEFSLLHNQAAAAQTWGLSATASIGKATATAATYTSSTSSSASSLTAKKTAAGSASAAVTGTATPQASGGLSAGAKAGIGIGVALSAVAVVAALWFCVMRARRRGRLRGTAPDGFGTPEMMGEQRYSTHQGWMGPTRHEMSGEAKMNELQGTPQAELSSVASPVRYG